MSEEELKAIEEVKRELTDEDRREYMSSWFAKDLDIILNLIEKQQKEIETQNKMMDTICSDVAFELSYDTEDVKIRYRKKVENEK